MRKWLFGFLAPAVLVTLCVKFPFLYTWLFKEFTLPIWLLFLMITGVVFFSHLLRFWAYYKHANFNIGDMVTVRGAYGNYTIQKLHFFSLGTVTLKDTRSEATITTNYKFIYLLDA